MTDPSVSGSSEIQWCFSQVKGTLDDDVTEGEPDYFSPHHYPRPCVGGGGEK